MQLSNIAVVHPWSSTWAERKLNHKKPLQAVKLPLDKKTHTWSSVTRLLTEWDSLKKTTSLFWDQELWALTTKTDQDIKADGLRTHMCSTTTTTRKFSLETELDFWELPLRYSSTRIKTWRELLSNLPKTKIYSSRNTLMLMSRWASTDMITSSVNSTQIMSKKEGTLNLILYERLVCWLLLISYLNRHELVQYINDVKQTYSAK